MFGKAADEAKVAEALEGLEKTLQVLDQRLAANQFLAGERCA
jgi:glutathione S-transferase